MIKTIFQGAEAIILLKNRRIIKKRIKKSYRYFILDERLRKQRTRKESKLLKKAYNLIPVPELIKTNENTKEIILENINGKKLSNHLDKLNNSLEICYQIGKNIAILHDSNIIHGDLTTSNMIYSIKEKKVFFIDFGLGFESQKDEDKAVDLHVLKEALEAKHFEKAKRFWISILKGYYNSKNAKNILKRLESVEKRGRYKQSY
ncbi:MAG: KEOPS complex kinase/ATPase Bud32 [Nanoarchaeota archaeon]